MGTQETSENVTFQTSNPIYGVDIDNDLSKYDDGTSDPAPLGTALERPVKIHEFLWEVNTAATGEIDLWTLWQSDAFVKQKLSHFAFIRCNLHIRIVPSSTPFMCGKLMFNYIPYGDDNEIWYNNYNTLRTSGATSAVETYMQYASTYPITGYVDPAENNVLEMKIPFIYHKNFLPVAGNAADAKVSLGKLVYIDLNVLSRANEATFSGADTINFAVFAKATDIELVMPTHYLPTAGKKRKSKITYSSVEDTEAVDGVISSPASAIANIAGKLSSVPVIGSLARATQIGATAAGGIARLFGFSNPSSVTNPQPRVLRLYRNLANTVTEDTAIKMSLDPNQELTIDPQIAGCSSNDDMVISSIISKEQWLTKGKWLQGRGQFVNLEPMVLATLVSSNHVRRSGTYGVTPTREAVQTTPAGHVGRTFRYWKGTVTYRIEVVCTQYHRGALQIQFDPFVKNGALALNDVWKDVVNTRQTVIMNISDCNSMEIEIDYISDKPFLKTRGNTQTTFQPNAYSDTTFLLQTIYDQEYDMGMLLVSVLNELSAPGDTSLNPGTGAGVDVNLYVKCGEEMVFAEPKGGWEDDIFVPTSAMTSWEKKVLVESADAKDDILTFFGEKVVSLRALLKRPTIVMLNVASTSFSYQVLGQLVTLKLPHFAPETLRSLTGNRRNCYESYFGPAFLAKRGAMRWKFCLFPSQAHSSSAETTLNPNGILMIERQSDDSTVSGLPAITTSNTPSRNSLMDLFPSGTQGLDITELSYKPAVDIEAPFYSSSRFALACNITNLDASEDLLLNPSMNQVLYEQVAYSAPGASNLRYVVHASTGEDYNLICYQAPPTFWEF